jgi:hypothetical protein
MCCLILATQTSSADINSLCFPSDNNTNSMNIGQPSPVSASLGVTHTMSILGPLTTNITLHKETFPPPFAISLNQRVIIS